MGTSESRQSGWQRLGYGVLLMAALAATGCQVNVGGQTLPSPYYLDDDIQYFAPGPEFPLAREAAAAAIRKVEAEELEAEAEPIP
jgi:hypothetical protein